MRIDPKFHCPRIAKGLSFNYDGSYDVCSARNPVTLGGSMTGDMMHVDQPLEAFMRSEYRQELLQQCESGTWPRGCESCLQDEQAGKMSLRQYLVANASNKRYLHVTMSNICDSDCAMCGPAWSTKIAARLHKHPDSQQVYLGNARSKTKRLWQDAAARDNLMQAASMSDHIHVLGGEPMIDPDVWQFLASAADAKKDLSFVTNLNTFPSDDKLAIMRAYKNVSMTVSVDAVGITHEWIRQGVSWPQVLRNMIRLRQLGISFNVHCTVQAHGVQDLAQHHSLFTRSNLLATYQLLQAPSLLCISNVPRWVLEEQLAALHKAQAPQHLMQDLEDSLAQHKEHLLKPLLAHTEYLNGHRQHRFNTDKWQVETA